MEDFLAHLARNLPSCHVSVGHFSLTLTPLTSQSSPSFTCTTSAAFMTITNPDYIAAHEADALGGIVGASK